MAQPSLKGQDIVVALKLAVSERSTFTYAAMASEMRLATSRVHASVQMLLLARLATGNTREGFALNRPRLVDLAIFGIPYFFPAIIGGPSRGLPTATALPEIGGSLMADDEAAYVWPSSGGIGRGSSLLPLHPCAIPASESDERLYHALMAVDVLRVGGARERKMAADYLRSHFA